MNVIRTRNVHRALPLALELLRHVGEERDSRNGFVLMSPCPVTTVYGNPLERVMFWPERDANPFFHFFESLWMLGGRNDAKSLTRYLKNFIDFSDDGETFHGAYGSRWRYTMPGSGVVLDQLIHIAAALKKNPTDRRQVLQMWNAASDLSNPGKDVPCNLMTTFQVGSDGRLNLVVFNRSNDIIWGCYGANAVQFSFLLEYVALRAGYPVGTYTQVSVNWHAYRKTHDKLLADMQNTADEMLPDGVKGFDLGALIEEPCPYETCEFAHYPLSQTDMDIWDRDLRKLLRFNGRAPTEGHWNDPFFPDVAIPIMRAHDAYKDGTGPARYENAMTALLDCRAEDWKAAGIQWLQRRYSKFQKEHDDGPTSY